MFLFLNLCKVSFLVRKQQKQKLQNLLLKNIHWKQRKLFKLELYFLTDI